MLYKKIQIKGYKTLNMYPVYVHDICNGQEPFKVVGIREHQVELKSDTITEWFDDDKVFVVKTVCAEQIKPSGCQIHNLHCCGGGYVINKHTTYWDNLYEN